MPTLEIDSRYDSKTQKLLGMWAAQLDAQSVLLKRIVAKADLEWQRQPGHNTIGMLLAHIAVVEIWWMKVAPTDGDDQEKLDATLMELIEIPASGDGMPLAPDGTHPDILAGKMLDDYLAMIDRARDVTHSVLLCWKDDELEQTYTLGEEQVSRAWTIYHVLEHLACHIGQIRMIRRDQAG